ncbi:MAG: hypothetical protein A2Y07_01910 [Planctomycetes bacterium GWF2_50_10]|nr:MAG: hypothetical protein A2Y07_01910 [Planctomycetes bacterium GWF2_50_10]
MIAGDAVSNTTLIKDITQVWDFGKAAGTTGKRPWNFVSYAYQQPYKVATNGSSYTISASTQAGSVVFADANPWMKNDGTFNAEDTTNGPKVLLEADLGLSGTTATNTTKKDEIKKGNSKNHQSEGQNVLFGDSHVSFENQPNVGIEQDNIYTTWSTLTPTTLIQKQGGVKPVNTTTATSSVSQSDTDSFLAN